MRCSLHSLFLLALLGLASPAGAVLMPVDVTYSVEGLANLAPVAVGSGVPTSTALAGACISRASRCREVSPRR